MRVSERRARERAVRTPPRGHTSPLKGITDNRTRRILALAAAGMRRRKR